MKNHLLIINYNYLKFRLEQWKKVIMKKYRKSVIILNYHKLLRSLILFKINVVIIL